jgi:LmbE family N-acetylglucosaminyl deacetylase
MSSLSLKIRAFFSARKPFGTKKNLHKIMPVSASNRLLIVGAHPDDETFGCGATIALETTRESSVTVCCLSGTPERHKELRAACKILGASVIAYKGKDLELTVPEVAKTLIPIIQELQPQVIISHSVDDYHDDHRVVHQGLVRAAEWAGHTTQYKAQAWRPHRLLSMEINTLFAAPTVLLNVSEYIDVKVQAIKRYKSQLKKTKSYYLDFNLQKARLRGLQGGCEYAEAFREVLMPVHGPFYNPTPTVKTIF